MALAIDIPSDKIALFWSRFTPEPNTGCLLWTGGGTSAGYGTFYPRSGVPLYVHRIVWTLIHGPIPPGLHVLHRCDTPLCASPDHLFLGTHADNMRDMRAKRRCGPWRKPERIPRGERAGAARISEAQALDALRRSEAGETRVSIARDLGVSPQAVGYLARGATWTHLPRRAA